jgi:hypothetical protein
MRLMTAEAVDNREAALKYRARGLAVIPVGGDGDPLVSCQSYQAEPAHPDEVETWWKRWPEASVGIVTGKASGILMLDLNGEGAVPSAKQLNLPGETWVLKTERGWCVFLQYPGDGARIGSRAGLLPHVDVRGDGGFMVLPPRVDGSDGKCEWIKDPDSCALAPIPPALLKLLLSPAAAPASPEKAAGDERGREEEGRAMSSPENMPPPKTIRAALDVLFERGSVVELRILKTRQKTVAGYFDDFDKLAEAAAEWDGKAPAQYVTLNPVNPALLARAGNRVKGYAEEATGDRDILRRRWLPIDLDVVRPSGIASTNAEHAAALARAKEIRGWLSAQGWPAPVLADSGNGAHLLYRVDLPNDDASRDLLKRCLEAVAFRFSDDCVSIDVGVCNAARIWKLYGTRVCKGDDTPGRPHRRAALIEAPAPVEVVSRDLPEKLAALAPAQPDPARRAQGERFDLDAWIVAHNLPVIQGGAWVGGEKWILNPCPWNPDHTNRSAFIIRHASGAIAAGCHHNGCQGKDWHALRDLVEPAWRERREKRERPRRGAEPPEEAAEVSEQEPESEPAPPAWEAPAPFSLVTPADSFVTKYVEYAKQRTDAPPAAHELMAFGILSALAGPKPRLPIVTAIHGWRLTLWLMYLVNTTGGRKTTVLEIAKDIIEEVLGHSALIEWEGSPQGLIQKLQLRDGQAAVFTRDEFSGLLKQINRGGYLAGLEQTFMRAFDGNRIENIRTRKKGSDGAPHEDTDRVESPYLTMLTAATWDNFTTAATTDNVLDGFLARFVFLTGLADPRPMTRMSDQLREDRLGLIKAAREFYEWANQWDRIEITDEVLADAWDLERAWQADTMKRRRLNGEGPSLKRLADTVLKLAGLLALDGDRAARPKIEAHHFAVAREIGNRWRTSTIQVLEALGCSEFTRNCEAIMESVRQHPEGITLSGLYRIHRNLRKRDFEESLEALLMQERIIKFSRQPVDGRSPRGRPPAMFKIGVAG